jgi:regulator of RNase E activity RraA
MFPEYDTVVGYAVTCREDTTTPRPGNQFSFERVYKVIDESSMPTIVVCQDAGTMRERSCHLGDMMATVMHTLGAVGFVTDGGIRDLKGLKANAPGFQVFAGGTVAGAGDAQLVDVGTPVSIFGLIVSPGDLLVGDANGLVSVPLDAIDDVLQEAEAVLEREQNLVSFISSPDFSLESYMARRRPPANPS